MSEDARLRQELIALGFIDPKVEKEEKTHKNGLFIIKARLKTKEGRHRRAVKDSLSLPLERGMDIFYAISHLRKIRQDFPNAKLFFWPGTGQNMKMVSA